MAEVQEAAWGGLIVKPKDKPNFRSFIIARRLQYSLDRRIEVIGVQDIATNELSVEQLRLALRSMLERASELELRGFIKRDVKFKEWSELKNLADLFKGLNKSRDLFELLVGDKEVFNKILNASPETLEIFPRLFPTYYLEPHLLLGGREFSLRRLVGQFVEHPDGLSWILKAHIMYGVPNLKESIRKNYILTRDVSERLEKLTLDLLSL